MWMQGTHYINRPILSALVYGFALAATAAVYSVYMLIAGGWWVITRLRIKEPIIVPIYT